MVSFYLDIKLGDYQTKSKITTKCDWGRFKRRRERERERGPPRKTNRTKPKSWIIYTFKSCCLILQQVADGWDEMCQPSSQVCHLWLGWGVRLLGVQVWGRHLNRGPLRNFAQSCLDIQVCSVVSRGQVHPRENIEWEWEGEEKRQAHIWFMPGSQLQNYSCQRIKLCDCVYEKQLG